jgi:hypothetical protein
VNRNSLMEMAGRGMHVIQRFTLNQGNDSPMMQELHFDGMIAEGRKMVERFQAFGFSSVPLPREVKQALSALGGGGGGGGGAGGLSAGTLDAGGGDSGGGTGGSDTGGDGDKGAAAEGICVYLGGQRNHPVCIAVDDRRHRPMGMKPGENAQYDHNGQMTLIRSTGAYVLSLDDEQQGGSSGGSGGSGGGSKDGSSGGSGGGGQQQQSRMASLRHVVKEKQKRPTGQGSSSGGSSSSSSGSSGGTPQDYKHEGQTINTEVRVIKNKIEFRTSDQDSGVVANHVKDSGQWNFMAKEHNVKSTEKHTVQTKQVSINGQNSVGVQSQQVTINGSTSTTIGNQKVSINGSQGVAVTGPTSVNGKPVATTDMFESRDQLIAELTSRISALEARF